jgi:hypothetical protein
VKADVDVPVQVVVRVGADHVEAEQLGVFGFRFIEGVEQDRFQRPAEPFVCWNVEAYFTALGDGRA